MNQSLDPDSPAFQCAAYRAQLPDLRLVDDCFKGQRAIQAGCVWRAQTGRGSRGAPGYLRQFAAETKWDFEGRVADSTFWNAYHRTITGLTGTVFRRDPALKPGMDARLIALAKNVDLMGAHFDSFARDSFQWSMNDGHGAILVDMPESILTTNPKATLPQERASQRAYWAFYRKGQIINWRTEQVSGVTKLASVTLSEDVTRNKGKYGQEGVKQYRVLYPGSWELFQMTAAGDIAQIASGKFSVREIPLAIIPCNPLGLLESIPCLLNLGYENIRHFKLQSALDNGIQFANILQLLEELGEHDGVDGLLAAGKLTQLPGEKPRRVISSQTIQTVSHGGDIRVIEPAGGGIAAAQKEIEATKRNMATLGLTTLFSAQNVASTATEEEFENEMETSALGGYVRAAEVAYNQAFDLSAEYMQIDSGGECEINRDFTRAKLDGATITALAGLTATDPPRLPFAMLWNALERTNILDRGYTPEKLFEMLVKEKPMLDILRGGVPAVPAQETIRL